MFNNYYQNPYQNYQNGYQQPTYQSYQQPQQTQYIPLTFVNGIEGAKAFIVSPNQTVYLRDSDSNLLFIKQADSQGKYSLSAFELCPLQDKQKNDKEYVTKEEFIILSEKVEKLLNPVSTGGQ